MKKILIRIITPTRRLFALVVIPGQPVRPSKVIKTEVCSKCHPFFTGQQQRLVDREGQVDRFYRKLQARQSYLDHQRSREDSRNSPNRPIADLGPGYRPTDALMKAGIKTMGQALDRLAQGEASILEVDGFGRKSLIDLKKSLRMIAFLFFFGTVEIMQTVYDGSIGSTLLKPFPLFLYWMASDLGRALVNLIGRGLLLLLVFSFFYPLIIPNRVEQWFFLPIALALGWLVSYAWRFLVNLAAFWTPDAVGFSRIAFTVSQLLSGFLMPLRIYPDWFADFCRMTPFAAMFNTTVEIYLGLLTGQQLLLALLSQLAWFILLVLLGQMVFTAGIRRLVIQGG
jgi:ABC-2 type transport system permease protein